MDVNDLTYAINGAIFEVHNTLGPGFLEKVYENALLIEMQERGYKTKSQEPIKVMYKGKVVGEYLVDLVVEDLVLLELKTVDKLEKIHEAQILNYLNATGLKVGLLVNFKKQKAEINRFVLNLNEQSIE